MEFFYTNLDKEIKEFQDNFNSLKQIPSKRHPQEIIKILHNLEEHLSLIKGLPHSFRELGRTQNTAMEGTIVSSIQNTITTIADMASTYNRYEIRQKKERITTSNIQDMVKECLTLLLTPSTGLKVQVDNLKFLDFIGVQPFTTTFITNPIKSFFNAQLSSEIEKLREILKEPTLVAVFIEQILLRTMLSPPTHAN